jgi:hypothetical protein
VIAPRLRFSATKAPRETFGLVGEFGEGVGELVLQAAASSGVADVGFCGRGFWIVQPIDRSTSQAH